MLTQATGTSLTDRNSEPATAHEREAAAYARILPDPRGFHVLLASGELARFDRNRNLTTDVELSALLGEHLRRFLQTDRAAPAADQRRLAILYPTAGARQWGSPTLRLEDWLVRELYPVGGRSSEGLTAFQQKRRENSVYRGMEVMLDVRHDLAPDAPVYCPVLFWRDTTVADYPGVAEASGVDPRAPVIEVLNLLVDIPLAKRSDRPIQALTARLHHGLIDKQQRRDRGFGLADALAPKGGAGPVADAYSEIERDRRLNRQVTLPGVDVHQLHVVERVDGIERWLKLPHQPVRPEQLRQFAQFRSLDDTRLRALADRSLVYAAPAGSRLLERGARDAWNMYLLEGSLMLTPEDEGNTLRVDGGSERAAHPVAFLKPRKYAVEALTPVSFLWVHDLLLAAALEQTRRP